MRVAVLGSWRDEDRKNWRLRGSPEAFRAACRQIGGELVRRGHSLIVGTDSSHTADGNAALGAIDLIREAGGESHRITVIRRENGRLAFRRLRESIPGVFVEYPVDAASWAVVKFVQAQLADALILVGGAEKTEQAGLAAAVSRKPLACIGSFGGAAAALNKRFAASPGIWGYDDRLTRTLPRLQEPFSSVVLKAALETAWIEGAPKLMIIHGRSPDRDVLKTYLLEHVGRVIVLADEFAPTEPIPTKFERFASSVDGAIALLTPDDVGGLVDEPTLAAPRARENVWIEVGWFWGHRSREKLLLLRKGAVSIPSDLGNVETCDYAASPTDCRERIEQFISRLRAARDEA